MRRGGRTSITWSSAKLLFVAAFTLLSLSWLVTILKSHERLSRQLSLHAEENQAVENLNLPPVLTSPGATLSGSHISQKISEEEEKDLDLSSVTEQLELAPPGQHPKVALMFLCKDTIPTEPIWRQFLENAGKLRLKVDTFKRPTDGFKNKFKNGLHPSIAGLDESRYPGYKIQHGLVPPSKYRSTTYPHVRRRLQRTTPKKRKVVKTLSIKEKSITIVNVTARQKDTWRNASNDGCKGEGKTLRRHASYLLNDPRDGHEIYRKQDFFTVYVHASQEFSFPRSSLFADLEVPDPVNVTNAYALHMLVMAEMKLLQASLQDERNQKFILLSESCIPIHPPEVIFAQVMHESKSRINACLDMFDYGRLELWRWKEKMETKSLKKRHWRKSQQWFILNRIHAELAVRDAHVKEVFKRYCWSYGKHICVSDEHYFPTLLASYGLEDETDCLGEGTWANWSDMGWHPKIFEPEEVSPTLLRITMNRGWPICDPVSARRTALRLFETSDLGPSVKLKAGCMDARLDMMSKDWASQQAVTPDDWVMHGGYVPMGYECPLFARKFSSQAVPELLNASLSCSGAGLGPWCSRWHRSFQA